MRQSTLVTLCIQLNEDVSLLNIIEKTGSCTMHYFKNSICKNTKQNQ